MAYATDIQPGRIQSVDGFALAIGRPDMDGVAKVPIRWRQRPMFLFEVHVQFDGLHYAARHRLGERHSRRPSRYAAFHAQLFKYERDPFPAVVHRFKIKLVLKEAALPHFYRM